MGLFVSVCVCVSGSMSMCLDLSIWKHPRQRQFKLIMQQSGPMTLWIIMVTRIIHLTSWCPYQSVASFGKREGRMYSLMQKSKKQRKKERLWYFMPQQIVFFADHVCIYAYVFIVYFDSNFKCFYVWPNNIITASKTVKCSVWPCLAFIWACLLWIVVICPKTM